MSSRLIVAIVTTLIYEAALIALVLWGLPRLGVYIPVAGLIALMLVLGTLAVVTYRKGSQALSRKELIGLPGMVGSQGKVIKMLEPEGMVKIKGELWEARTLGEKIGPGQDVIVIGQDRLRLIVRKA